MTELPARPAPGRAPQGTGVPRPHSIPPGRAPAAPPQRSAQGRRRRAARAEHAQRAQGLESENEGVALGLAGKPSPPFTSAAKGPRRSCLQAPPIEPRPIPGERNRTEARAAPASGSPGPAAGRVGLARRRTLPKLAAIASDEVRLRILTAKPGTKRSRGGHRMQGKHRALRPMSLAAPSITPATAFGWVAKSLP